MSIHKLLFQYMINNYEKHERIRWILENTRLHILPCLNPDGWEIAEVGDCTGVVGRHNKNDVDLNRNFPHFVTGGPSRLEQIETRAVIKWNNDISFALAGDFHAGAVVTIYPFHRMTKTKYGYESE